MTKKKVKIKTRIAILLDSSGSMQSIRKEALDMFNEQVRAIKKGSKELDTKVSFATFATESKTVFFNVDVKQLKELNLDSYNPDGGTAMYDSVGAAIDALSFLPEASDENTSFLVVIVSDGEENSSRIYNSNDVANRVQRLQNTKRWTFSYLGSNQDLGKVSRTLNIPIGNTMSFTASGSGMRSGSLANSTATSAYLNNISSSGRATSSTNFYDNNVVSNGNTPVDTKTKKGK